MFFVDCSELGDKFFDEAFGYQVEKFVDIGELIRLRGRHNKYLGQFSQFVIDSVVPIVEQSSSTFEIAVEDSAFGYGIDLEGNTDIHRDTVRPDVTLNRTRIFCNLGVTDRGNTLGTMFPVSQADWERSRHKVWQFDDDELDRDFEQPDQRQSAVFNPDWEFHCAPQLPTGVRRGLFCAVLPVNSGYRDSGSIRPEITDPKIALPKYLEC